MVAMGADPTPRCDIGCAPGPIGRERAFDIDDIIERYVLPVSA
jgi:hypothetical protein